MHSPAMLRERSVSLAITGASGAAYGLRLLECLLLAGRPVHLMISAPARVVIATETEIQLPGRPQEIRVFLANHFGVSADLLHVYGRDQWMSPVASGSSAPAAMVVCPCSTGRLSAIACGSSRSLIERAADVMLKERRKLILVPRETPFSPIHLEHMLKLAQLGVTILPASPGFYHKPTSVQQLVDFVVGRVLDHLGVEQQIAPRWSGVSDE